MSRAQSNTTIHGKHYRVECDENMLEADVSVVFKDQIVVTLRVHEADE